VAGPVTVAVIVSAWVTTTTPPSVSVNVTVTTFAPLPPWHPLSHTLATAKVPNNTFSQLFAFVRTLSPTYRGPAANSNYAASSFPAKL
jgi:hypothetical protein